MYTILGAGGAIANALATELSLNNIPYKLVSRSPKAINGIQVISADLTDASQTLEAVKGSSVVVLCAGLKYDSRVWKTQWPAIMRNTIDSCKENNAKLIFFDNVYMLGKVAGNMTEKTPYNPVSKKGEVRAKIATDLMNEVKAGNINAIIARAADFYGPDCKSSILNLLVFDKMAHRKTAQWVIDDKETHSFTFTPDCGKALLLLSQNENAWNQIWHMPTASPALTGKQIIGLAAKIFNVPAKHTVIGKGMIGILGIFMRTMYEMKEMLYQYDSEYIFDSTKFDSAFDFKPTTYHDGFEMTVRSYKKI